jgi:hypothetical protein
MFLFGRGIRNWHGRKQRLGVSVCALRPDFWELLERRRRTVATATAALLAIHAAGMVIDFGPDLDSLAYSAVAGLYGWSVVLTLCGYAAHYLDRPSRALAYLNEAVLPIYVVHQPILLVLAYLLFPLSLPVGVEALALVAGTGAGSLLAYEAIARRTRAARFLFGLKPASPGPAAKLPETETPRPA